MDGSALSEMMFFLANGVLEGAPNPVVDVIVLESDGSLCSGYATKVSVGGAPALTLTAQGMLPAMGEDTVVDLDGAVWVCAMCADGSTRTFGADAGELDAILDESLAEAKRVDPKGADVAQLTIARATLAHARGDLGSAESLFRGAIAALVWADDAGRERGDLWMRLAAVSGDLGVEANVKLALTQAASEYEGVFGANHPLTARATLALRRLG